MRARRRPAPRRARRARRAGRARSSRTRPAVAAPAPTGSRTAAASARRPPPSSPGCWPAGPWCRTVPTGSTTTPCSPLASELEGHPDNAAACLLGGLTLAWTDGRRRCTRSASSPRPDLRATVLVPERRAGHRDGARPAAGDGAARRRGARRRPGRAAGGGADRRTAGRLLLAATEDRLHQGYRAPAMPATLALVACAAVGRARGRGVRRRAHRPGAGRPGRRRPSTAPAGWRVLTAGPGPGRRQRGRGLIARADRRQRFRGSGRSEAPMVLRSHPHQKPLKWPVPRHDSPVASRGPSV